MGKNRDIFKTWYAVSFALQLGFLIAVTIGGFILLGVWGDKTFHTFPLFFIAGIVTGLAATAYEVSHLLTQLIKNNHD